TRRPCLLLLFLSSSASPGLYTLSLHDALPISGAHDLPADGGRDGTAQLEGSEPAERARPQRGRHADPPRVRRQPGGRVAHDGRLDRKSTRLNSSHVKISYAVFCLKKKNDGMLR